MTTLRRIILTALAAAFMLAAAAAGTASARPDDVAPAATSGSSAFAPSRSPNRPPDGPPDVPPPAEASDPTRREYVVFLNDAPPLAKYRGGIAGLAPTAADLNGDVHLDLDTPAAVAYTAYLDGRRAAAIARLRAIAPRADIGWQYHIVAHGFTVGLTADEAVAAKRLPGFDLVFPDEKLELEMDSSTELVRATEAWQAVGGVANAGLGSRVAILDTGMDIGHPWFHDDDMPAAPEGFPSALMVGANTTLEYPDPERFVNNKVIAARVFVRSAQPSLLAGTTPLITCPTQSGTPTLLAACGDHGLHTAGTAAGRHAAHDMPYGSLLPPTRIGGVAPMAHVLTYVSAAGSNSGFVAAIEQAVKDEVDAISASLGTVGWLLARPERHPISIAADAAADAGTLLVASAGNAGSNGRTSLSGGWKYGERSLIVGNASTNGSVDQPATVSGAGVPAGSTRLNLAPMGLKLVTTTLAADLLFDENAGCSVDQKLAGKVVFIDRLGPAPCGSDTPTRLSRMASSNARAVILYYNDRNLGGPYARDVPVPALGLGLEGGKELAEWLRANGSARITIEATAARTRREVPDVVSASSSQGPGLDWSIKPDIAAPGEDIMSSVIFTDVRDKRRVYAVHAKSGTSMATPHVTGAVAVLRSAHPDWTTDQIRSAIINTSSGSLQTGTLTTQPALPYDGGPGRLDVAAALDPGAFLSPPKLSFGRLAEGATKALSVTIESDLAVAATWSATVQPVGSGGGAVTVVPDSVTLEPGETATLSVTLTVPATVTQGDHWGDVVLETDAGGTPHRLRQQYYASVDQAAERRNVLIVDWAYGSKVDHTRYYTEALEAAGLTYTVWVLDNAGARVSAPSLPIRTSHPPLAEMSRHDMVILNMNESKTSLMAQSLSGMYQYLNYMLRGGSFLIAGQGTANFWRYLSTSGRLADTPQARQTYPHTWPFTWGGAPSQNFGCEMCLTRYFTGFTPELTATLSGRLLVPFPQPVDRTARDVVLEPNASAEAGSPFHYPIDLSTGANAADGAAGNQYAFASGSLVTGYKPSTSSTLATGLGDYDYGEGIVDDLVPLARPLWQYTGEMAVDRVNMMTTTEQTKVVGTYVAGQQHPGTGVTWNAMFWGFGLEGVGAGSDERTVTRERLLGDTFNFLARNIAGVTIEVNESRIDAFEAGLTFPDFARPPMIEQAEIAWGDGNTDRVMGWFDPFGGGRVDPRADEIVLKHTYAVEGEYDVSIVLHPTADAAPIHIAGTVTVTAPPKPPTIFLPISLHGVLGGDATMPSP